MMKTIYVFSRDYDDGLGFQLGFRAEGDNEFATNSGSGMKSLVKAVKAKVNHLLQVETLVIIKFKPKYNVECLKGHFPARCYPLSEKEQDEFWKYFREEK